MINPEAEGGSEKLKIRCQEAVDYLDRVANELPSLIDSELSKKINKWQHCFITQLSAVVSDLDYLITNIPREEGDRVLCGEYQKELGALSVTIGQSLNEGRELSDEEKAKAIKELSELANSCASVFRAAVLIMK